MTKDLLSAVYIDLEEKKRRSNNIVISGLPVAPVDRDGAESFLRAEFHEIASDLKVTVCRRLGRKDNDRIQPLLVTCSNAADVQFILDNAKRLRRSNYCLVRYQIYINPDLTKAEAAAAFEIRQKRRAARARDNQRRGNLGGRQQAKIGTDSMVTTPQYLNLNAVPFHPTTSSAGQNSSGTPVGEDDTIVNSE